MSAAAAAAGTWGYQRLTGQSQASSLTLETTPAGLAVTIDGKPMGSTPLTVSLAAGNYAVVLSTPDGRERALSVTLTAGGSVVQRVELAEQPPAAGGTTGALRVETQPVGQPVTVDGVARGVSPLTVPSLAPGEHAVVVRNRDGEAIRRTITVQQGETVSLVISGPDVRPMRAGWVTFQSPIPLEFVEDGRVVGTTDAERLMLPAGEHQLEMVNDALGYRETRRIAVAPDRTTEIQIVVPTGALNINALPWAEVWVGGERVGETPIANLQQPIGTHEVLLRHPQLGERRAQVTVSLKEPARLGVDMRTP